MHAYLQDLFNLTSCSLMKFMESKECKLGDIDVYLSDDSKEDTPEGKNTY